MIGQNEVLLKHNNEWLYFAKPHHIISATRIEDVREALRTVERLVNTNDFHAAGFLSYEAAPAFDGALRVIDANGFPLLWFGLYPEPQIIRTSEVLGNFNDLPALDWHPSIERGSYNAAIEKVKEYISQGKTYQVNYTMRLNSEFTGREWNFFQHLAQSQNKYAAYIDTGRHVICSASPELFFKLDGDKIFSRPMKGTVKRGLTTAEDKELAEWLHNSKKNRAENVMIVDMIRNDLGRIAKTGSVNVPELFAIETYPTLLQMTSTVQARTDASLDEIFCALFPCASITGAPKVSTMKIIAELETSPRRIYTGSIGYISPNRKAQFSVAIRTALIDREAHQAEYGVGGGIVWDSTSADEYGEALLKARVLQDRPHEFSLFETLLWTPEEGYFLREKHIERIQDSAEYFGFNFSVLDFDALLDEIARPFTSTQRVKILLKKDGELKVESTGLQTSRNPYKVCLATQPINSKDVFLYHKTTRREIYDKALIVYQSFSDVLLYNESDELTEFTIGNLAVEMDGKLFTPPISCGLLPGTFRSHLLETGQVAERIIKVEYLKKCRKVYLINSVRKWLEVDMQ